jgi:hypothetical protein
LKKNFNGISNGKSLDYGTSIYRNGPYSTGCAPKVKTTGSLRCHNRRDIDTHT